MGSGQLRNSPQPLPAPPATGKDTRSTDGPSEKSALWANLPTVFLSSHTHAGAARADPHETADRTGCGPHPPCRQSEGAPRHFQWEKSGLSLEGGAGSDLERKAPPPQEPHPQGGVTNNNSCRCWRQKAVTPTWDMGSSALPGIYPEEPKTDVHTETCTQMLTAALFIFVKLGPTRCPSVGDG